MIENPFTFGNPIREASRFYGREDEIRQIANRLLSSGKESTSIVGERRIGKTSLLMHIADEAVAASLGLVPERYCLIYIDFQGLVDITPQRFWERVLKKMKRSICHQELVSEIETLLQRQEFDLFDLEDLFEGITHSGLTTVLLMDEFEYVTQNPNFKADFFGGLRALAIHHNLPLIPATRRELVDLCHSDEIKGSPFFNIFASVILRPFNHQDAQSLVDGYLHETSLSVTQAEKDLIVRLGGGNPFFTQMAGYYLVEAKQKPLSGNSLVNFVSSSFAEQTDPHFTYLWSHCSDSEKITLLAVISLNRQKATKKNLPRIENLSRIHQRAALDVPELGKRGLLIMEEDEQTYRVFSPSYEVWIRREIAATPEEEESSDSVDEWLRESGQDLARPVEGALPKFKRKYWPVVSSVLKELSFELAGAATFEILVKALI